MGFVLSILYLVTYYLTPDTIFGPLAAYRIELIFAVLVILASLPRVLQSFLLKTSQPIALIGLAFAVLMSILVGMRWFGGGVQAFLLFIPNAFAYFIACLHFNSKKRLQVLVLVLLFACLFVSAHGAIDLVHGISEYGPPITMATGNVDLAQWNADHPYLLVMSGRPGEWLYRIRGLGEINDPNDFAQLIVCVIPLVFIFWRPKKTPLNLVCVVLPVFTLLVALFLTRSRGALLALLAIAVMATRRRIGTIPGLLVGGALFAAATALQFTGGREISASAGEDRTALWGIALQLFKSHPLFGIGLDRMSDFAGATAHNSVAVCVAELGLVGLFFWCLFLFPTVRDALAVASPKMVSEGETIVAQPETEMQPAKSIEIIDKTEVNRLGQMMVLSLTGYLVAGWFLSRALLMTLFLLGGMAEVVYEMALQRGMIASRLRFIRVVGYSALLAVVLLLMIYVMIRALNLMH